MSNLTSLRRPPTKHVVFIAGPEEPDLPDFAYFSGQNLPQMLEEGVEFLQSAGLNVSVVGDAKSPLDMTEIRQTIQDQPEGALIIVMAHGEVGAAGHELINGAENIPTYRLFDAIGDTNKPMNLLFLACQSGVSHHMADESLPKGSIMATMCSGDQKLHKKTSMAMLSKRIIDRSVCDAGIAIDQYLLQALPAIMQSDTPTVTVAGRGTCALNEALEARADTSFTLGEKLRVFNGMRQVGPRAAYRLMNAIHLNPDEVAPGTSQHGVAIAAIVTASDRKVPLTRNSPPASSY